ncbi:MAG TPA: citrate lyase acyl carrier protein [Clostridiaceae bacterium]|nr:citrate lyase acyl carrier protein [Clostridiaceae bacterium]
MKIKEVGIAGTLESSDILIKVEPSDDNKITISLDSLVIKQFGNQIRKVIMDTACELGVEGARITAIDKGALDCTIRARTAAAIYRAGQSDDYIWEGSNA